MSETEYTTRSDQDRSLFRSPKPGAVAAGSVAALRVHAGDVRGGGAARRIFRVVLEHHLFDDGYLARPLTFAAAAAAGPTGFGWARRFSSPLCTTPAEIAEQSVVVDILSGGRLDLGLGTGSRVPEVRAL